MKKSESSLGAFFFAPAPQFSYPLPRLGVGVETLEENCTTSREATDSFCSPGFLAKGAYLVGGLPTETAETDRTGANGMGVTCFEAGGGGEPERIWSEAVGKERTFILQYNQEKVINAAEKVLLNTFKKRGQKFVKNMGNRLGFFFCVCVLLQLHMMYMYHVGLLSEYRRGADVQRGRRVSLWRLRHPLGRAGDRQRPVQVLGRGGAGPVAGLAGRRVERRVRRVRPGLRRLRDHHQVRYSGSSLFYMSNRHKKKLRMLIIRTSNCISEVCRKN